MILRDMEMEGGTIIEMALMLWFGFIGAWLLVAGPLFQGVHELQEQEIDREGIEAATAVVTPGPRPSGWWWLFPPLMFVKLRQRRDVYWREALAALPADQVAQISAVRPMMYGWFIVSLGAAFLAMKETWELAEHYHWPTWLFLAIVVLFGLLAVLNATIGNGWQGGRSKTPATRV